MESVLSVAKTICVPHYITNILLCVMYFVFKTLHPICTILFNDCKLEMKEWEWLTFLCCIIVIKNRKQATYLSYLSTACMFGKALNLLLFFKQGPFYGLSYAIMCLLHLVYCPEPMYSGPENFTYFRGVNLVDELERDKKTTWVIAFYAAWSPSCISFAPIFSKISSEYSLTNLKFGKLDASRYPEIALKYNIDTSTWSKQLPSVILFQEGKEKSRLPYFDAKNRVVKYFFQKENMTRDLGLNDVYLQCKKTAPKKKQPKVPKDTTTATTPTTTTTNASEEAKDADSKKKD